MPMVCHDVSFVKFFLSSNVKICNSALSAKWAWLLGFCPWRLELTDLITTRYERCSIYNCFARDSIKTSNKHQAIIKSLRRNQPASDSRYILKMWWLQLKKKNSTRCNLRQSINSANKCKRTVNACCVLVFVSHCHDWDQSKDCEQ